VGGREDIGSIVLQEVARLVDVSYTLRWDPATNMPYYLGFLHSTIRWPLHFTAGEAKEKKEKEKEGDMT
jgi:hypothetical protein